MKNYLNYSIILLVTLCFGLTSCSKDDEGNSLEKDFYEVTIDGQTYKDNIFVYNDHDYFGEENGKELNVMEFFSLEKSAFYIGIGVNYFKNAGDFQNSKVGTYKVVNYALYQNFKNLDISVALGKDFSSALSNKTPFAEGTHTVTEIKNLGTDKEGNARYSISGNFSFKESGASSAKTITGKYKVTVNPLI